MVSGARQKDEDWDPSENGGFAVHGMSSPSLPLADPPPVRLTFVLRSIETDPNQGPVDPLAALEKSTAAENHLTNVQIPRLEALQDLSDRISSDPYTHSQRVRKRFREQKKLDTARDAADERLKSAYGPPETLALAAESDESRSQAREEWEQARQALEDGRESAKRLKLGEERSVIPRTPSSARGSSRASGSRGSASGNGDAVSALRAKILGNTAKQGSLGGLGRLKPPDSKSLRGSLVRRT